MKKAIIIIAITVFTVFAANAQKSANYVTCANSNNDTLQYLHNNFENQKAKYIGQPLSKIFNDLELKILNTSPLLRTAPGTTGIDKRHIAGISLGFYDDNEMAAKTIEDLEYMKLPEIIIYTTELLLSSDFETLIFKDPANVDADLKALYSSNNYVVADIEVSPYINSTQSRTFTKSNCGIGGIGSTILITVPAGTNISTISQADADNQVVRWFDFYQQQYDFTLGTCTYNSKALVNVSFRKNNCIFPKLGSYVVYSAAAGAFTSTLSQADADAKAQAAGQANANANGTCN